MPTHNVRYEQLDWELLLSCSYGIENRNNQTGDQVHNLELAAANERNNSRQDRNNNNNNTDLYAAGDLSGVLGSTEALATGNDDASIVIKPADLEKAAAVLEKTGVELITVAELGK